MDKSITALALLAALATVRWRQPRPRKQRLCTVEEFKEHYKAIAADLVADAQAKHELPANEASYLRKVMDYTIPGGKVNRGLTVVQTAQAMRAVAAKDMRALAALGWVVEWLQASFLVADDMMDSSVTRRGQPCWYLVPGVGNIAINDALVLLTQCELLVSHYLGSHPHVNAMRDVLLTTIYETELGQLMDVSTQPPGAEKVNFSLYTMARYKHIVKYKTAFYTFVAPVRLGMLFAGVTDAELHAKVSSVCLLMGEYFQIQDDVLDVYGAPEVIGKIGTDIQDAKCSWLVVTAMGVASPAQMALLQANYGKKSAECELRVKQLFKMLELESKFAEYEERTVSQIRRLIGDLGHDAAQHVCTALLDKIYKREK